MSNNLIESRISEYLRDQIYSFIVEGPSELLSSQCKYHYCISRLVWYKVRIVHTCVIKLEQNHPLYWIINQCGTKYIQAYTGKKFKCITYGQCIFLLLFEDFYSSNHLTLDGCKEELKEQKNKIKMNSQCNQSNLANDFQQKYVLDNNISIKQINSQYSIQGYKEEIKTVIGKTDHLEGFIQKREIVNHKGVEYEQSKLVICYYEYKELEIQTGSDMNNNLSIQISSKQISEIINKQIIVNSLIKRDQTNQQIKERKLISIDQPSFLELLIGQKYQSILPDVEKFYKQFTQKIVYTVGVDFQKEDVQLPFKPGSVLRVDRGAFFHAGVYLKLDLVIHVKITKKNQNGQIFNFDRFDEFLADSKIIEEIRFDINFFTLDELFDRALRMNQNSYNYQIDSLNCEHLSFQLVTELNFSPQVFNSFTKFLASIFGKTQQASIRKS